MMKDKYRKIRNELISMWKIDQQAIKNQDLKEIKKITKINILELKLIIKKMGWPTVSKVGSKASKSAWFIAQHAVYDYNFQKKCLDLMKKEKSGEVNIQDIAYLEDRVLVHQKRKQIYGTQFYVGRDKKIRPRQILRIKDLDNRRKTVGLSSFAEYKRQIKKISKKYRAT